MNQGGSIDFAAVDIKDLSPPEAADAIILQAFDLHASDLYIMSEEDETAIAVRRLGTVQSIAKITRDQGRQIMSVIKAKAGMDIAEHRRPLDGRLIYHQGETKFDLRINCIPTLFGEDMSCRLLQRSTNRLDLDQLGMSHTEQGHLRAMLNSPSGLILVTGPTSAGKTTTLYACLESLNDGTRKINTLEDPVEYSVSGIRQSQVDHKLGIDFAILLRNVLRQAPDVIMIGEIRDEETAQIAVRAANSGHLVLATLHAPVAAGAVQSLLALGSHPFFLASCLLGVVAQRLIRTLCPHCRQRFDISSAPDTFAEIKPLLGPGEDGTALYGPGGCQQCFQVGYADQTGLFEIMPMNQQLRHMIVEGRPST